jgi:hypothetical protein
MQQKKKGFVFFNGGKMYIRGVQYMKIIANVKDVMLEICF